MASVLLDANQGQMILSLPICSVNALPSRRSIGDRSPPGAGPRGPFHPSLVAVWAAAWFRVAWKSLWGRLWGKGSC